MNMSDEQPRQPDPATINTTPDIGPISETMEKKAKGSNFTIGQTWGALKKCWRAYRIAKTKNDKDRMVDYAEKIRRLQTELGVAVSEFPNLGLTNP
jgi:hypothetical protein